MCARAGANVHVPDDEGGDSESEKERAKREEDRRACRQDVNPTRGGGGGEGRRDGERARVGRGW